MANGMFSTIQSGQYYHAKQACYICVNASDLVDTGVQIEGEGVLALCVNCIRELAQERSILDEIAESEVAEVAAINTRLALALDTEKKLTKRLRAQIRAAKDD